MTERLLSSSQPLQATSSTDSLSPVSNITASTGDRISDVSSPESSENDVKLVRIDSPNHPLFADAWSIYDSDESFPSDERRTLQQQAEVMKKPQYNFNAIVNGKREVVGVFCIWTLDVDGKIFNFGEHAAIKPELRNRGYISQILVGLKSQNVCCEIAKPRETIPFIMAREKKLSQREGRPMKSQDQLAGEIEEENENRVRRKRFYERVGIKAVIEIDGRDPGYIQPPYGPGKPPVPLYLCVQKDDGRNIGQQEFDALRKALHTYVYSVGENDYPGAASVTEIQC